MSTNKNTGFLDFTAFAASKAYADHKHHQLFSRLAAALSDEVDFDYIYDVYRDTGDIYSSAQYFEQGCISFFIENKGSLLEIADELAKEVGMNSTVSYLHCTMEEDCEIENVRKIVLEDVAVSDADISDELYVVAEWLTRYAIITLMDAFAEYRYG